MSHKSVIYKYGTGNPVHPNGSQDVRDGIDNLQSFDIFMNDESDTYNQRDGEVVQTVAGAIRSVGFKPGSGDFSTGFTVMPGQRNHAWYDPVSLNWYSYIGVIPITGHVVSPGTNPVGDPDWKPVTDELLRNELAAPAGAGLVGSANYSQIRAYDGGSTKIQCYGRVHVFDKAHGSFFLDPSDTTSPDDDGYTLVDALGRRWKRQMLGEIHPEVYGAKGDGVAVDTIAMRKAVAKAYELFCPVKCLGGTYLLTEVVELIEPFKFKGNGSRFIINHSGDGFHVKSSTYAKKRNINSLKDMNFLNSATPPSSYIRIGVASVLEPTNIELNGIHFKETVATIAHIINERSYGLKINNSALNEVQGTCILFKQGIGSDESVYSYNCYINQVDITGCDYGVVIEGGKVQIRDSVIESCRQRGVWSKGIGFNPSIYLENVYFENNIYSLYFESQQNQGYTLNSEVKNCFFQTNSGQNFFSANNNIRLSNNKGWSFSKVEGSGRFSLAGSLFPMPYNPNTCPDSLISLESPYKVELGSVAGGVRKIVPFFNLRKKNGGRTNTAMKITIVRETSNIVTYYQAILQANDINGMTWRIIQIASQDASGIVAAPTFEKNPSDATDMNLYFYYPNTATVIITVEGEGGFG